MKKQRLKWWLQFWWILAMTVFLLVVANYLKDFEDTALAARGVVVLAIIFNFLGWRYAILWYRELIRQNEL
jgi:hypothetical protein